MSAWLIALTGLIYAGVAVDMAMARNWPMVVVYAGYAFSNVGLYYLARLTVQPPAGV